MMMYELTVKLLPSEAWYGLCASDGSKLPLTEETTCDVSLTTNPTDNQAGALLLSNKGRYIWSDNGFEFHMSEGSMKLTSQKAEIILKDGFETLKGAFLAASKAHFAADGKSPPEDFFTKPQFNTWIELLHEQTQENILNYAKAIVENGFPVGILMIDAHWHEYHGSWKFHTAKFTDPKALVDELHKMGFKVMLWTCPFVSPDSLVYHDIVKKNLLLKGADGEIAIRNWWYGYSAVLDLTNPEAINWYNEQNQILMDEYGVDGFKFDAGDAYFYCDDDKTFAPTDANGQSRIWAELGLAYPYNEYRATWQAAGHPIVERLADRCHSWGLDGMASLVPNILAQGILGYAFTCPDMIGGGQIGSFEDSAYKLDEELFIRYAQCAALMPMMQFSTAPWRVLSPKGSKLCRDAVSLHEKFADYIVSLAHNAAVTGEPILRYMEYEFPNEGFEQIHDQFMLGSELLVAPVCIKGKTVKTVILPKGDWEYVTGEIFEGGKPVEVAAPIEVLPYFIKK